MSDLPTPSEIVAVAQGAFVASLDPTGTGRVNLQPGSRNDTLISVITGMAMRVSRYAAQRFAAARLSSSTGDDLDEIANDIYKAPRQLAQAAVGSAYFSRPTATFGATVIPAGTRVSLPAQAGQPAVTFITTQDAQVGVGQTGVGTGPSDGVPMQCTQLGRVGNVSYTAGQTAGGFTPFVILDPLPDTTWTLYVPTALAGGNLNDPIGGGIDPETDAQLIARLGQLSINDTTQLGTLAAVKYAVLTVPGLVNCVLVEPQDGTIVAFAGDANFVLPNALAQQVKLAELAYRCGGVSVLLRPFSVTAVPITATIHMARALVNYDVSAIIAAANGFVTTYFNTRPQPDEYFVNAIEAALFRAHPEVQEVNSATDTDPAWSPTSDVLRAGDDPTYAGVLTMPRYTLSTVSITVKGPIT